MTITLEKIYEEIQELKNRVIQLEKKILLSEEEYSDQEIEELLQISQEMSKGNKTLWKSQ